MYYHTGLWIVSLSRFHWVFGLESRKTKIKMSAGLDSYMETLGKDSFLWL